jgi:hypothetical protein
MTPASRTENDQGAVMVIALFLAVFLLGLLYYVVGTTQTVFFREHLQDTADGAALSGAVMHARCMNLIVLVNIVMAALLAILVTIKLVEGLAIIGMVIAAALAWFTGGSTLAAIPPLKTAQADMDAAYQQVQPPIFAALEALHTASSVVSGLAPAAADGVVLADIAANAQPAGSRGIASGTRLTLPVSDDTFPELCGRASQFPIDLAKDALGALPGVSDIMDALDGPMHDMTKSLSDWFCGDGGSGNGGGESQPPPYKRDEKRAYPRMDLAVRCENEHIDASGSLTLGAGTTSPTCEASKRFEDDALPDQNTGGCQTGHDCSANGPYEQRVAKARLDCDPTRSPRPSYYLYLLREGSVPYRWTGKVWQRLTPTFGEPQRRETNRDGYSDPPCGPKQVHPFVAEGYQTVVRESSDVTEVQPVCSRETPPGQPSTRNLPDVGHIETVPITEVMHILGCQKTETISVQVSNGKSAGSSSDSDSGSDSSSGSNSKSPKRIEDGATLGDENFQIRALIQADSDVLAADQLVRLTLWNQQAPSDGGLHVLRALGGHSVAQAEYFYDGTETASEWMWNMKWRARLRRFRLPDGGALTAIQTACGTVLGSACGVLNTLSGMGDLVVH